MHAQSGEHGASSLAYVNKVSRTRVSFASLEGPKLQNRGLGRPTSTTCLGKRPNFYQTSSEISHVPCLLGLFILSDSSPLGARREGIRAAALGYLRTFFYLIRHESELYIAQHEQLRLIHQYINWTLFCNFTSKIFKHIRL